MTIMTTPSPLAIPQPSFSEADITMEFITPDQAEMYLAKNISNRHLRPGHYKALASDMTAGRWQESHMGLAFDTDGNLIDGQHRLHAIIESDEPQWMIVVRNVPKAVQEVIDAGAARSAADALKLSNRVDSNHPAVAAAARIAILWSEDHHRTVRKNTNGARKVTNSEITEWVDEQIAIDLAGQTSVLTTVPEAAKWRTVSSLMSLSVTSFVFLLFSDIDEDSYDNALTFFTNLDDLNFTGTDDPVRQLYLRLNDAKSTKESMRISEVLWFVITAWNAFRAGTPLADPFVTISATGKVTSRSPKPKKVKGIVVYPRVPDPI